MNPIIKNTVKSEYNIILKGLQDEGFSCNFRAGSASCNDGSVYLSANSNGNVTAYGGSGDCSVFGGGGSICGSY